MSGMFQGFERVLFANYNQVQPRALTQLHLPLKKEILQLCDVLQWGPLGASQTDRPWCNEVRNDKCLNLQDVNRSKSHTTVPICSASLQSSIYGDHLWHVTVSLSFQWSHAIASMLVTAQPFSDSNLKVLRSPNLHRLRDAVRVIMRSKNVRRKFSS